MNIVNLVNDREHFFCPGHEYAVLEWRREPRNPQLHSVGCRNPQPVSRVLGKIGVYTDILFKEKKQLLTRFKLQCLK